MKRHVSAATKAASVVLGFCLALTGLAHAQTAELVQRSALRVCADPANMPFSNKKLEGFENKLASLLAKTLNVPVVYTWFPQATGFLRRTLLEKRCDIIMGYPQGHELVLNTNPYYRSAYVLIYRTGSDLEGVKSLDDPRLRGKHLGVMAGTPPASNLARYGLINMAKPYHLVVDRRFENPAEEMIHDLAKGKIDGGLLWGPIGGYYAKNSDVKLTVVPLLHEKAGPRMAYRITMAVRLGETEWKHQLNDFIREHKKEINEILLKFGVPLLDEADHIIKKPEG